MSLVKQRHENFDENDVEAKEFIDFLGLNHPTLYEQRANHIKRLEATFQAAHFGNQEILEYFSNHEEELSHVTAIETAFNVQLSNFIKGN